MSKSAVRFIDAWTCAAVWFGMDILMEAFGSHLPDWLQVEVDFKEDFTLAVFLIWMWIAFRRPIEATSARD
jgi:hypothetical protein